MGVIGGMHMLCLFVCCVFNCNLVLLCVLCMKKDNTVETSTISLPVTELTTIAEENGPKAEPLISPAELMKWLAKIEVSAPY